MTDRLLIRTQLWLEFTFWSALARAALVVFRPVAVVVDVFAPRLRCLRPSTDYLNRRTPW